MPFATIGEMRSLAVPVVTLKTAGSTGLWRAKKAAEPFWGTLWKGGAYASSMCHLVSPSSPFVFEGGTLSGTAAAVIIGVALIGLSLPRGDPQRRAHRRLGSRNRLT
jgi:hypothetical protein